jgi:Peptidase family M3
LPQIGHNRSKKNIENSDMPSSRPTTLAPRRVRSRKAVAGTNAGSFALSADLAEQHDCRPEDTMSLAHKLGHALHFELARARRALQCQTSIPMLEVASTFSEALIAEHLRARAADDRERLALLAARLEDAMLNVFQGYYVDAGIAVAGEDVDPMRDSIMTLAFNILSNCPVLAVPSGWAANGVPTGVQIVGRTFDDATVFRVGMALERARPWGYQDLGRLPTFTITA